MMLQLHWQNRQDLKQTEFVAQVGDETPDMLEHLASVAERRQDECPQGWVPLICTEGSEHFVMAKTRTH